MKRCVIITAYQSGEIQANDRPTGEELVICADGGYESARSLGICPDLVIGDFDSLPQQRLDANVKVIRAPKEKDETDTLLCIQYGMAQGCTSFLILGGLGGRLDHTFANLQLLAYGVEHGLSMEIRDGNNRAMMIEGTTVTVRREETQFISLFAFSGQCTGVTITGVKYPLQHATLKQEFPLGVSNECIAEQAEIHNETGKLLILLARE